MYDDLKNIAKDILVEAQMLLDRGPVPSPFISMMIDRQKRFEQGFGFFDIAHMTFEDILNKLESDPNKALSLYTGEVGS